MWRGSLPLRVVWEFEAERKGGIESKERIKKIERKNLLLSALIESLFFFIKLNLPTYTLEYLFTSFF